MKIIDGSEVSAQDLRASVCVLGSGMGGAVCAMELKRQGVTDIVVVEAGDFERQGVVTHHSVGVDFGLPVTRDVRIGGTSNIWAGVCTPLDSIDFENRDWMPHSGWPIARRDLDEYYRRVADYFKISDFGLFGADELVERYGEALAEVPLNGETIEYKLFQHFYPSINIGEAFRRQSESVQGITLLKNCVANELLVAENGHRLETAVCGCRNGEGRVNVRARNFVLALGALETPRLVLNSLTLEPAVGDAGAWPNVGRFLMDHPMGNLGQIELRRSASARIYHVIKTPGGQRYKVGLRPAESCQRELRLPNHAFYMLPSFKKSIDAESEQIKKALMTIKSRSLSPGDIYRIATNPHVVAEMVAYFAGLNLKLKLVDLWFVTEQVPSRRSRVELSHEKDCFGYPMARAAWLLANEDYENMRTYYRYLERIFPASSFDILDLALGARWYERVTSAAHHMGTMRMGLSSKEAVVDSDQKVFGLDNAYVADASVFPTSGNANPSFTIAALAARLAAHIAADEIGG